MDGEAMDMSMDVVAASAVYDMVRVGELDSDRYRWAMSFGADIDWRDASGRTALMVTRNPLVVSALAKLGANLECLDKHRTTALGLMHTEAVATQLVRAGCNPNVKNKLGFTPWSTAIKKDFYGTFVEMLDRYKPEIIDRKFGSTPLHVAAMLGNLRIVKLLLMRGASVNARDNRGDTPLVLAVKRGVPEGVVKALIDAGAELDGAMEVAKDTAVVQRLLESGAEPGPLRAGMPPAVVRLLSLHWPGFVSLDDFRMAHVCDVRDERKRAIV